MLSRAWVYGHGTWDRCRGTRSAFRPLLRIPNMPIIRYSRLDRINIGQKSWRLVTLSPRWPARPTQVHDVLMSGTWHWKFGLPSRGLFLEWMAGVPVGRIHDTGATFPRWTG